MVKVSEAPSSDLPSADGAGARCYSCLWWSGDPPGGRRLAFGLLIPIELWR